MDKRQVRVDEKNSAYIHETILAQGLILHGFAPASLNYTCERRSSVAGANATELPALGIKKAATSPEYANSPTSETVPDWYIVTFSLS